MKRTLLIVSLILCTATLFAQSSNQPNRVEVFVSVDTLVQPDRIEISTTIKTPDLDGKKGLDVAEGKFIAILESEKLDVKNDLRIENSYSTIKTKVENAMLVRTYTTTVKNIATAQSIIEQTYEQKIGNSSISKIRRIEFEECEKLLTHKALLKARAEAEFQASVLGQKIGNAVLIHKQRTYGRDDVVVIAYGSSDEKMLTGSVNSVKKRPEVKIQDLELSVEFEVHFLLCDK